MEDFTPEMDISLAAARIIAQGMMRLAAADGVHPKEKAMIEAFLADCYAEAGGQESYEEILDRDFDIAEARQVLDSDELRELFLKSNLLLACADGIYSEPEQNMMDHYAIDFGITAGRLRELETQVKEYMLSQFAGVQVFRDKAEALGRQLGLSADSIAHVLEIRQEISSP